MIQVYHEVPFAKAVFNYDLNNYVYQIRSTKLYAFQKNKRKSIFPGYLNAKSALIYNLLPMRFVFYLKISILMI